MNLNIGFMQGRLSSIVDGKIQSFPWNTWEQEITHAKSLDLSIMEWTLDQDRLYENPLMTSSGQAKIVELCKKRDFTIPSLTGDCFMQAPFWRATDNDSLDELKKDFNSILEACSTVGIKFVVVPLVDDGRLENMEQENILVEFLLAQQENLNQLDVKVVFESDFHPAELKRFISRLNSHSFGINYDTGNSAALGFDVEAEFNAYGDRILNVHIKDRVLGGTTVPLGAGSADFEAVFSALGRAGYHGNYILQTARAQDGDHAGALCRYHDTVVNWIARHES